MSKLAKIILFAVIGGLVLAVVAGLLCFIFICKKRQKRTAATAATSTAPPASGFTKPTGIFGNQYAPVSTGGPGAPYVPPTGPTQYESTPGAYGNFEPGYTPTQTG